jgi:hypothetical protein
MTGVYIPSTFQDKISPRGKEILSGNLSSCHGEISSAGNAYSNGGEGGKTTRIARTQSVSSLKGGGCVTPQTNKLAWSQDLLAEIDTSAAMKEKLKQLLQSHEHSAHERTVLERELSKVRAELAELVSVQERVGEASLISEGPPRPPKYSSTGGESKEAKLARTHDERGGGEPLKKGGSSSTPSSSSSNNVLRYLVVTSLGFNVVDVAVGANDAPSVGNAEFKVFFRPEFKLTRRELLQMSNVFAHIQSQWQVALRVLDSNKKAILPPWLTDADVANCGYCYRQHTAFLRKHHCRLCGCVFCDDCTSLRYNIPKFNFKAERLCQPCYGTLQKMACYDAQRLPQLAAPSSNANSRTPHLSVDPTTKSAVSTTSPGSSGKDGALANGQEFGVNSKPKQDHEGDTGRPVLETSKPSKSESTGWFRSFFQ